MSEQNVFDQIYAMVKCIPKGHICTYGQIAAMVRPGMPARVVGYALNCLKENSGVPWHRIVNKAGAISYAASRNEHDSLQHILLEKEGIEFSINRKINLEKYLWRIIPE